MLRKLTKAQLEEKKPRTRRRPADSAEGRVKFGVRCRDLTEFLDIGVRGVERR